MTSLLHRCASGMCDASLPDPSIDAGIADQLQKRGCQKLLANLILHTEAFPASATNLEFFHKEDLVTRGFERMVWIDDRNIDASQKLDKTKTICQDDDPTPDKRSVALTSTKNLFKVKWAICIPKHRAPP